MPEYGDEQVKRLAEIDLDQTEARLRSGNYYGAERMLEIAAAHLRGVPDDDALHGRYRELVARRERERGEAQARFEAKRKALRWVSNTDGFFERLQALQLPHWSVEIVREGTSTPVWVTSHSDAVSDVLTSNGFKRAQKKPWLHMIKWKNLRVHESDRLFERLEDLALEHGLDPYPREVVELRNERTHRLEEEIAAKVLEREAKRPRMADA